MFTALKLCGQLLEPNLLQRPTLLCNTLALLPCHIYTLNSHNENIRVHVYQRVHAHLHTCRHLCIHIYMSIYIYIYTYIHILQRPAWLCNTLALLPRHMYTLNSHDENIRVHVYQRIHAHLHTCRHLCIHIYMCIYIYIYV